MLIRIFLWQFFDLLCICYLSRKELSILHYNFWGFLILALEPASCKSSCNQGMPRHETILYHLEQQELHRQVSLRHFWLCLFQKRSPKSNLTKSSFRQFKTRNAQKLNLDSPRNCVPGKWHWSCRREWMIHVEQGSLARAKPIQKSKVHGWVTPSDQSRYYPDHVRSRLRNFIPCIW